MAAFSSLFCRATSIILMRSTHFVWVVECFTPQCWFGESFSFFFSLSRVQCWPPHQPHLPCLPQYMAVWPYSRQWKHCDGPFFARNFVTWKCTWLMAANFWNFPSATVWSVRTTSRFMACSVPSELVLFMLLRSVIPVTFSFSDLPSYHLCQNQSTRISFSLARGKVVERNFLLLFEKHCDRRMVRRIFRVYTGFMRARTYQEPGNTCTS